MKLYLISQDVNRDYDTYDSAVVAAKNKETARNIPVGGTRSDSWANPEDVKVVLIGTAIKGMAQGTVLASFNAG